MQKPIILLTLSALSTLAANAADPEVRIVSGVRDTLYTPTTVIVGVTAPGAKATVNGRDVHVYKTGSFAERVSLSPGQNVINVDVNDNGATTTKTLNIYRAEAVKKSAAKPEPALMMFTAPRVVETLPGAYLQYGDGDDRLGGSKMGFIDPGILLTADGERGSLYRVRLGIDRIAYLPKEYAVISQNDIPTVVNTGSWSVTNTGKKDRVTISLPTRLAWHAMTTLDPNEICVDVFGAFDNSNWITQRTLDLGIIDYVDFRQMSADVYRIIIRLKDTANWGFTIGYDGKSSNLAIDVRHSPKSLNLKDLTIGLDAGHGGQYPGAISPSGIQEKDVNLDIVERLKALLEKAGATVVMTRNDDSGPSMTDRKHTWADADVDFAISVHNNSGATALDSPGTSVYYKHMFCRPFAETMCRSMVTTGLPLFGLVGNFNFSLAGPTNCPSCLVEGAFMSSLAEEEKLADPDFRQLMARKIYEGITNYLKTVKSTK